MDYIFKDWEKKMSAFESSVEKDLAEIRKCKADMQDMRRQMHEEMYHPVGTGDHLRQCGCRRNPL